MPQIKQMSCHHPSHNCIILINGIYSCSFLFITDDNQWDCLRQFLYLLLKIRIWITAVDNAKRLYCTHHAQIFLLQTGISLCITDKDTISLLVRHCFNSLQKQYIIRACKRRAKNNDQLLFPAFFSVLSSRKMIT